MVADAGLEWHELNGICYGFDRVPLALNFDSANSTCEGYNGALVSAPNYEVHTFITSLMEPGTDYWANLKLISLRKEYLWPDGTSPDSGMWYPNEPNLYEERVRYSSATGFKDHPTNPVHLLADIHALVMKSFICQRNAVRIGEIGIGKEISHSSAAHYVEITNISTKSRLQCAKTCLQTFKCGLIGYLSSSFECLMLQWSADNVSLSVDPGFRFHTIERDCSIS
ncbi:struthiocalcin-2-like [Argopecten irradians]|uniref:struthiocalcin-2-like n=1 Tax=Argopecten irradians TaxID=31199 RepID=UPI00371E0D50